MPSRPVKGRSYINFNVSVSSIFNNGQFYLKYYFLHHRSSPLIAIQLSVNCYVSILNFHLGGRSQSPPKNIPYRSQQTDVTKTSFLSIFFNMLFYIVAFSILTVGKHIDM